jgi:hypothetical protein
VTSDGFTVDHEALGAARDRIGRLAEELAVPPRDVPSADVIGHDRLNEAVNEFADREKRGLALLAGEAEAVRHELAETIKAYRRADEDGAGLFKGIEP